MRTNILHAKKTLLALFAMLMPMLADAQVIVEIDDIWYNLIPRVKQAEVTNSNGTEYSGSITIPATVTYNGVEYSVTSIGGEAFSGCSSLTSITIPEGVTSIGDYTFRWCSALTAINIPESVTSIGGSAFSDCSSLTAISVAEGNTIYDSRGGCNAIIETNSNTLISGCATTIIPEGVTSIGNRAFYYCSNLTTINIPEGVTNIGSRAFEGCNNLTDIIVTEGNTVYDSRGGCNAIIETNSNTLIAGCSTTIIPEGVTNIGRAAFAHCSNLTSINIPEGVTSIGYGAFEGCNYLTDITLPKGLTSIGEWAFSFCLSLTAINIPKGVTRIRESAFDGCRSLTAITIPEGVTSIGGCAFQYCSLTAITLPEGVTSIGSGAFANCSNLTAITIPESVTNINGAFFNCSNLIFITCEVTTPPTIEDSSTFFGVDKSIPVYVPEGSVDAYKAAEYWREFTNIQAIPNEFTLTISAAGYATMFLDYAVAIPEDVAVFYASSVEGNRLMMTRVTGVLPANTGVIVRAEAGTYTFEESKDMPANVEGNLLSGTATDTYITAESGYKYYVLARKEGLVAMYRPILTDGRFLNNANKAYIALDTNRLGIYDDEVNTDEEGGQLSNSLRFDFGGTTTIENLQFTIDNSQIIYDLHGRRITDTEGLKGIYIVNGRKVVI